MSKFKIGDIVKLYYRHALFHELKNYYGIIIYLNTDEDDLLNYGLIKIYINNRIINVEEEQIYIPKKFKKN